MKPEIYSCLKMLEALEDSCVRIYNTKNYEIAQQLLTQYQKIRLLLKEHLDKNEFKFVQEVDDRHTPYDSDKKALFHELLSACSINISFLRSLDRNLDMELKQKEQELKMREKEIESLKKILEKSLEAVNQLPEVQRSKAVADWKKNHREIEENSKKKNPFNVIPL